MTVPITGVTPIFGLEYPVQGEPAFHIRQKWQRSMQKVEAALAAGPASPPGASDLLAVSGRVSVLEAESTGRSTVATPTFSAGWAQGLTSSTYQEAVRCWKEAPTIIKVVGICQVTTAITAGSTSNILTLPTGYRPSTNLLRLAYFQSAATAPVPYRIQVLSTGVVQVLAHAALAVANWVSLDMTFRTVNT